MHRNFAGILTYIKNFMCNMTGNIHADDALIRASLIINFWSEFCISEYSSNEHNKLGNVNLDRADKTY